MPCVASPSSTTQAPEDKDAFGKHEKQPGLDADAGARDEVKQVAEKTKTPLAGSPAPIKSSRAELAVQAELAEQTGACSDGTARRW